MCAIKTSLDEDIRKLMKELMKEYVGNYYINTLHKLAYNMCMVQSMWKPRLFP